MTDTTTEAPVARVSPRSLPYSPLTAAGLAAAAKDQKQVRDSLSYLQAMTDRALADFARSHR